MLLNDIDMFGTPTHMVMDPVHGGIEFFSHECKIINHPNFQRLRSIKQNDILYLVFPGANHSRFEHSIGTMHVAGRLFRAMLRNYFASNRQKAPIVPGSSCVHAIQYCYACIRIAALLHDTGHFPFSHQFESSDLGKVILADVKTIEKFNEVNSNLFDKPCEHITHEHVSVISANYIMSTELNGVNLKPQDIICIMENGKINPSDELVESAVEIIKLFIDYDITKQFDKVNIATNLIMLFKDIISGEIDADKMDYLLRDSYYSGCNYGIYNLDHIIKSIYVGWDIKTNPQKPWIGLSVHKKGIGALEDFVYSRFRMYLQVYNHKTVVGFKWILQSALNEINSSDVKAKTVDALFDINKFNDITDSYFFELFRKHAASSVDISSCLRILQRRPLQFIASKQADADHIKERYKTEFEQTHGCSIIYFESAAKFSKIKPRYDKIRILTVSKLQHKKQLEAISENSSFFNKFDDITEVHYYKVGDL